MPTQKEIILDVNGRAFRREINEYELNLGGLPERLATNLVTRIPSLHYSERWGMMGLAIQQNVYYVTLHLPALHLKIPCYANSNGIINPDFTQGSGLPIISLDWKPKDGWDLGLKLLIQMQGLPNYWTFQMMWLAAVDGKGLTWRLPLPNLHTDIHVCHGTFVTTAVTMMTLIDQVMTQFETSQWNDHLWTDGDMTRELFRWKPLKDGFEVLYPEADWKKFCTKVGVTATQFLV